MLAATVTAEELTPITTSQVMLHCIINLSNYSSLDKLIAIAAYVYRFISNLKSGNTQHGPLSATELYQAKMYWIKDCQQQVYGNILSTLLSSPFTTKRLPLVRQLHLFLDKAGVIHCGGRIHNAPISQLAKFPYLLPPRHSFTSLIVHSIHVKLFHAETNSTLTAIRQTYWIPTARQYIKALLCHCVVCKRHCGRPFPVPDPAPLPEVRTHDDHWSRFHRCTVCPTIVGKIRCTYACSPVPLLVLYTWKLSQIYLLRPFCWLFGDL